MAIGALPHVGPPLAQPRSSQSVVRGGVARGEAPAFGADRHGQGHSPHGGSQHGAASGAQAEIARPITPPHGLLSLQMDQLETLQGISPEGKSGEDKTGEDKTEANTDKTSGETGMLTEEEEAVVRDMANTDREVRRHEQAHAAAGGAHAGAPSYQYQQGPDGKRYAVNGEVSIDTSPVQGDPKATIAKMRQVKAAANAPAQPSGQDRSVSAAASAIAAQAEAELRAQSAAQIGKGVDKEETPETTTQSDPSPRSDAPAAPGASSARPGRIIPPGSVTDFSV